VLFAVDFDEHFIDEEGITIASMFTLQSACINGTEFDTPEANRLAADGDIAFSQKVFDISMTQIETTLEPDGVTDNIWWESVAFVSIHAR
jgi:hypothetical protein